MAVTLRPAPESLPSIHRPAPPRRPPASSPVRARRPLTLLVALTAGARPSWGPSCSTSCWASSRKWCADGGVRGAGPDRRQVLAVRRRWTPPWGRRGPPPGPAPDRPGLDGDHPHPGQPQRPHVRRPHRAPRPWPWPSWAGSGPRCRTTGARPAPRAPATGAPARWLAAGLVALGGVIVGANAVARSPRRAPRERQPGGPGLPAGRPFEQPEVRCGPGAGGAAPGERRPGPPLLRRGRAERARSDPGGPERGGHLPPPPPPAPHILLRSPLRQGQRAGDEGDADRAVDRVLQARGVVQPPLGCDGGLGAVPGQDAGAGGSAARRPGERAGAGGRPPGRS